MATAAKSECKGRVLFLSDLPLDGAIGGTITANIAYAKGFQNGGYDVWIVNSKDQHALHDGEVVDDHFHDTTVHGLRCRIFHNNHKFLIVEKSFKDFNPDIVIISPDYDSNFGRACRQVNSNVVTVFIMQSLSWAPCGPYIWHKPMEVADFGAYTHIKVCSYALRNYLWDHGKIHSEVWRVPLQPPPDCPRPSPEVFKKRKYVTMVNPSPTKGMNIFIKLAEMIPEQEFLAICSWATYPHHREQLQKVKNITIKEATQTPEEYYEVSRLVLAPSLFPEALCLVVLEAQSYGVPVLVSNVGGIIEAKMNTEGILPVLPYSRREKWYSKNHVPPAQDRSLVLQWEEQVRELLTNDEEYEKWCIDAWTQSRQYMERDLSRKMRRDLAELLE